MKKYRKKLSEVTNMGYKTLADEFDFDGVNAKLSQVDGMEYVAHLSSKKSTILKGAGAVSLRIEDINESVSKITEGMNGLFETKKIKNRKLDEQKQKQYKMSKTYQTWDEEALEVGDTDDKGFEYKDQSFDSLWDLAKEIRNGGGFEPSTTIPSMTGWWSSDGEEDYRSGEKTFYSWHPKNLSKEDNIQLYKYMKMSERDFQAQNPDNI